VLALAGSDFGATLDGAPVDLWTSFEVRPGQMLRLGHTRTGARCYVCVQGGIEVDPFLGSASTHVLSGLGGFRGRALQSDDVLKIGAATGGFKRRTVAQRALDLLGVRKNLLVTPGPQSDWFSDAAQRGFYSNVYRISEESNRMGLRLQGAPLAAPAHGQMITEGVSLGAIQIPAGGMPIILFVEQQTTGGYPKIANVISADMHAVGQLRPRDEIRFEQIDFETARSLLREQEQLLASKELILES